MVNPHTILVYSEGPGSVWDCRCGASAPQTFSSPGEAKEDAKEHTSGRIVFVEPVKSVGQEVREARVYTFAPPELRATPGHARVSRLIDAAD